jgi:hypothetical protein
VGALHVIVGARSGERQVAGRLAGWLACWQQQAARQTGEHGGWLLLTEVIWLEGMWRMRPREV